MIKVNIIVVNEVEATTNKRKIFHTIITKTAKYENEINLIMTLGLSVFNNFYPIWNKKGGFHQTTLGIRWKSKLKKNKPIQFCLGFDLIKSAFWTLVLSWIVSKNKASEDSFVDIIVNYFKRHKVIGKAISIIILLKQKMIFLSLIIHLTHSFNIYIAIDSLIWIIVAKMLKNN